MLAPALHLQDAGVFALLLEAMPAEAAAYVRDELPVPGYGIGAGPELDGQLLIAHDLLGSVVGEIAPRFVRRYAAVGAAVEAACRAYAADVRAGRFPGPELCDPMDPAVEVELRRLRGAVPLEQPVAG